MTDDCGRAKVSAAAAEDIIDCPWAINESVGGGVIAVCFSHSRSLIEIETDQLRILT